MKRPDLSSLPDGLNYAGVALTFLAGLALVAATTGLTTGAPYLLPLILILFATGQLLVGIATVGATRIRFTVRNVTALVLLYTLRSFWDLFSILIGLPFILATALLGPLMFVVFTLASVALGLYLVERVIGLDVPGYLSLLENPSQVLLAAGVWVLSLLALRWHLVRDEGDDWLLDRAGDLILRLRQAIRGRVARIVERDR